MSSKNLLELMPVAAQNSVGQKFQKHLVQQEKLESFFRDKKQRTSRHSPCKYLTQCHFCCEKTIVLPPMHFVYMVRYLRRPCKRGPALAE